MRHCSAAWCWTAVLVCVHLAGLILQTRLVAADPKGRELKRVGPPSTGQELWIYISPTGDLMLSPGGPATAGDKSIGLSDPDRKLPFTIADHFSSRLLNSADFQIEFVQQSADGSFWLLDTVGPLMLHAGENGKILEPPQELPGFDGAPVLRFRESPFAEESAALRAMNAIRLHARKSGNEERVLVYSPWDALLEDGGSPTVAESRVNPPQGSGLEKASTRIFPIQAMKDQGFPVIVWTVNDKPRMLELMRLGVSGIISDRPDLLREAVEEFAKTDAGKGWLDRHGILDGSRFDAQGHRGARNLRPENTLPAMEAALDYLMTTLETDAAVTKDHVAVLSHDPVLSATKCRRADGKKYDRQDEVLIKDLTLEELQESYICDRLLPGRDLQRNDPALSPVSQAFAKSHRLPHVYSMPSVGQLFEFVRHYVDHYTSGPGKNHPQAEARSANALRVRFNIETKTNPRREFRDRTIDYKEFARVLADTIQKHDMQRRADIQSFDFRTLLEVHERYPEIRTVCLFGDFPVFADPSLPGSEDGVNLQPETPGQDSPWLAGMHWPYRQTGEQQPYARRDEIRFQSMSLDPGGESLRIVIERHGDGEKRLYECRYLISKKRFSPMIELKTSPTKR